MPGSEAYTGDLRVKSVRPLSSFTLHDLAVGVGAGSKERANGEIDYAYDKQRPR